MLKVGGVEVGNRLSFTHTDLEKDAGWREAVAGCEYRCCTWVATSPTGSKNEPSCSRQRANGTRRVLPASRDAGWRVVLTPPSRRSAMVINRGQRNSRNGLDDLQAKL